MQVQPGAFTDAGEILVTCDCDARLTGRGAGRGLEGLSTESGDLAEHVTAAECRDCFAVACHFDLAIENEDELMLMRAFKGELCTGINDDLCEDLLSHACITAVEAEKVGYLLGHQ